MEAILKPYVKKFDEKGTLTNPISKQNPYLHHAWRDEKGVLHQYPNRRERRAFQKQQLINK